MAAAWGSWGPSPLPSPRSHSVRVLKGPRCGRCQLLHQMSCSIKSSTPACRRWCRPSLSNGSSRTGSTPSVAPCARPRSQLPADSPDPLERTCKVHCASCKRVHYESWRVSERAGPVDCHSERRGHGKRGCPQRACGPDCQTPLQRFQTIGGSIGAQPHSRSERHYRPGAPTSPLPTRQCKEARPMPIMACRMPSTVTSRCLRSPHVTLAFAAAQPENRSPAGRRRCNAHLRGSRSSCWDPYHTVHRRLSGGVAELQRWLASQCCDRKDLRRHSRRTCQAVSKPKAQERRTG